MICELCGKGTARERRVTRSYGKGANLLLIENIPTVGCSNCGESYLTANTLHEIDRIKRQRIDLAKSKSVDVAAFAQPNAFV